MTGRLRAVITIAIVAVVVAVGAFVYYGGGDDTPDAVTLKDTTQQTKVDVDTPELQALKKAAGIRTCAPGPGGGAQLPDVKVACLGGGPPVTLSSLRGPMLLSFWNSACGPCRQEMPALQAFDAEYGSQVPVVGLDFVDTFPGTALQQMKKRGVTYPSLIDPLGDLESFPLFAKAIHGMPTLFFLDAAGKVAFAHPSGVHSEAEVVDLVHQYLGVDL